MYFVESSRKAALGHQRRILCLLLVSLLGLLIFVVAVGKSPHSSDLLLGRNEDGKSRTAKKQSSRIIAERTTQAEETGADINSSAGVNEAKQKQNSWTEIFESCRRPGTKTTVRPFFIK